MPGFMNIDFVNQIRQEEKIGGGGTAIIYKGIFLDPKLREVLFFFFFFFLSPYFDLEIFICFSNINRNLNLKKLQLNKCWKIKDFQQKIIN